MVTEVLATAIVQTEVDVVRGLEGEVQGDYEWVTDLLQDVYL